MGTGARAPAVSGASAPPAPPSRRQKLQYLETDSEAIGGSPRDRQRRLPFWTPLSPGANVWLSDVSWMPETVWRENVLCPLCTSLMHFY